MMIGGLNRSSSSLAIIAAAGLFAGGALMTPAQAADLGGDCCADLEERVAELEATAVRHGNRAVRLTLSGQVSSQLMYWDDGVEDDIYVIDSDEASSRIRLQAEGTISPGVTAGLIIEFDVEIAGGGGQSQADDDAANQINNRRANWYVNGPMGRISIGQGSQASDGALEVSFANTWVAGVGYGLATTNIFSFTTTNANAAFGGSLLWGTVGTDGDTGRSNRVRYDSPTFAGFTLSASAGEDDFGDVALRYANEFGGLRVAAAAMYNNNQEDGDVETFGGSLALSFSNIHIQGGYSETEDNISTFEREHYWIAAGVQFRGSSYGMSEITVQYAHNDLTNLGLAAAVTASAGPDGLDATADDVAAAAAVVGNAEYDVYGIGFAQNIDAVGGTLYLSYNHHELDASSGGVTTNDEFDQVQFGMRLRY